MAYNEIRRIFAENYINEIGVAEIDDLMPLFCVASKKNLPNGARSVIVMLMPYYFGEIEHNISRYAVPRDYHTIGGGILSKICDTLKEKYNPYEFKWFVDASPINEVRAGYLAGLGVIGRNGQLINKCYGSYTFIGTIVTDMELPKSTPIKETCKNCGLCEKRCPENALENGKVNKERCRSHITQKKGQLTKEQESSIKSGGLLWGCDICTDCCIHNQNPIKTSIKAFYEDLQPILTEDNLDILLSDRAYGYRGRGVLERNLRLIKPI